ncbi:MAG: helix-turn-helix transcriptional regulator [Alphaproteobacteria bacterium]|nr:helix-turn-helix transcriptional regulator [Alphaproteobacteria bacterium]
MNHESIWNAIDRIAQNQNLSVSGLAKKAGLNPTTFNKSKRLSDQGQERWPSTRSITKVLEISKLSWKDFPQFMVDV